MTTRKEKYHGTVEEEAYLNYFFAVGLFFIVFSGCMIIFTRRINPYHKGNLFYDILVKPNKEESHRNDDQSPEIGVFIHLDSFMPENNFGFKTD